jgi:hypothetical protein
MKFKQNKRGEGGERKNPQELVRGLSREIGILVSPLDDDEDVWFFWIFYLAIIGIGQDKCTPL